jgi:ethanolamine utilization protein EutN
LNDEIAELQNCRIAESEEREEREEGEKPFLPAILSFLPAILSAVLSAVLSAILQSCNPAMQIGRVIGTVVATQKHPKFEGAKLLLVQPLNLDGSPRGVALLAVDGVGAGVHERVLVVLEGRAAGQALGRKAAPVDAAIVGIVDQLECVEG